MTKVCTKCNEGKPVEAFAKHKSHRDGLQYWCKDCTAAYKRQWNASNRGHTAEYDRQWHADNQQRKSENNRKWREASPERVLYNSVKSRYPEAVVEGEMPDPRYVKRFYGDKCVWPGCTNLDLTIDHVFPMSKGGKHIYENLQPLCVSHNTAKFDKTIDYRVGANIGNRKEGIILTNITKIGGQA